MAFTKLEPTGVNTSATFTFANVSVTGNINTNGLSNLGPVGNVHISGGASGYVLSTDGSGTLSWVAQTGGGTDYSNANVASYLPTYTGELSVANVTSTGNITASYLIGNGSQLTGLPASYANSNVASYLPTHTGNISANYFIGNGSTLTNITGGNVTGQVANALVAGTVYANSQPNITSIGTLASLAVNSNVTAGNISGANLISANYISGNIATGAQPNITSVGTLSSLSVTGNISGANLIGNHYGNGSALTNINGSNVTGQVANALVAGTVYTNAQPNITSVGTLASLSVTGLTTATGGVKTANIYDVSGTLTVQTKYNSASGDIGVTGNIIAGAGGTGNVSATNFIGNIVNGTQSNITSLGSLSGLTVSNTTGVVNFTTTANVTLGSVANLHISGGTTGQYLKTDGSGTLSWATVSSGSTSNISNGTSNVNIAASGGNVSTSVAGNVDIFVVTGTGANVNGYLSVNGTLSAGTGSGGSISGANSITANYFIGNGSLLTGLPGGGGGATITNDTTTASNSYYPVFTTTTSGTMSTANVSTSKLYFNPSTGTLNSTIFNSLSDKHMKSELVQIADALGKVKQLTGYLYTLNDSGERSAGLLSQDVYNVLPEAVRENNGIQSLNYNATIGLIVESIKILSDKVDLINDRLGGK